MSAPAGTPTPDEEAVSAPIEPASEHVEEKTEVNEEVKDEREEIVHVGHDDALSEEVAAAEAAVVHPEQETATEKEIEAAETAAEVADVAEGLDAPETATDKEVEAAETAAEVADVAEKLDEPEVETPEVDQEVKVTPLPAFENAGNPVQLAPGEPIPEGVTAATIDDHVKLDKESYESEEPTVTVAPVGEEQEFKVSPLPAFENAENPQTGVPIPEGVATESVQDHVKLDQESYENTAPSVPIDLPDEARAETPVQEVAETAAEVADVAQKLDEPTPEEAKGKTPASHPVPASPGRKLMSRKDVEPTPGTLRAEEPVVTAEEVPGTPHIPTAIGTLCTDDGLATPAEDKTTPEPAKEESAVDVGDLTVPSAIAGTAIAAAASAVVFSRKSDEPKNEAVESPKAEHLADETGLHKKPDASPVTKAVDESTAHRAAGEELITEPAPQASSSPIHGEIAPETEVPKLLPGSKTVQRATPTVVVSPVAEEGAGQAARTIEIVQPTPAGEIFTSPVWNQSVSPFLQYSLENSPEGIRPRKGLGAPSTHERPASSGSDIVSARSHRNIMHNFWQVFFFNWFGGVGRYFAGVFGRKKKEKTAARAAAANAGASST